MNQTTTNTTNPPITAAPEQIFSSPSSAAPDIEEYRAEIMEFDLSHDQQTELLQTLWNIMSTFVDIGWGVDTVQIIRPELLNTASESKLALEYNGALDSNYANEGTEDTNRKGGK